MAVCTTLRVTLAAGNTAGTGALTTYANNVAPDIIVKAALDVPKVHFEVGGIGRFLRNEYFPVIDGGRNGIGSGLYVLDDIAQQHCHGGRRVLQRFV